jgi:hypothetical protein
VCGITPTGWTPEAVSRRRCTVNKPSRLSPWLNTRTGRVVVGGMTRGSRSWQVAWNSGMAAGFFCVTGPRHLELRLKARPHDGVERVLVDVQVRGLCNPLTQFDRGGEASGLPEHLLQRGQHIRRKRQGLASRHVQRQQGVQAS